MKTTISQVLHSARPHLWPFISLNVTATGLVARLSVAETLLLCLCLCSLATFGFILNDLVDRGIDGQIHPDRLATANSLTLRLAQLSMCGSLLLALSIAYVLGTVASLLVISIAIALAIYSLFLRKQLLVATLACAYSITSALWGPFIIAGTVIPFYDLALVCVAFVLVSARETILDMNDVNGDRLGKRHTIATIMSERISIIVAIILTMTGLAALLVIGTWRILTLPGIHAIFIGVGLAMFAWLVIRPTARLARAEPQNKHLFDSYVLQTRRAMALIPLFIIIDLPWKG